MKQTLYNYSVQTEILISLQLYKQTPGGEDGEAIEVSLCTYPGFPGGVILCCTCNTWRELKSIE